LKIKKQNRFAVVVQKNGVQTEEFILHKKPLTIGSSLQCDLTVSTAKEEKVVFLKQKSKGAFTLTLPEGVKGTLNKKDSKVPFAALIDLDLVSKKGKHHVVELTEKAGFWGEVTDGDTVIKFGFREDEVWVPNMAITGRLEMAFVAFVALSIGLHFAMVAYLKTVEIEEVSQVEALKKLPKRFSKLVLKPKPKPKVEKPKPKEEEPKEEEKPEEKPKETKKPTEKPQRKKPVNKELEQRVSKKGLLGVIGSKGGIMSSMGGPDLTQMDSLIGSSTKAQVADSGAALDTLGVGDIDDLNAEIESQTQGTARTKEEILAEKKKTAVEDEKIAQTTESGGSREQDESQVYGKITSYIGGLKFLYNNRLRTKPTLKGSLTVLITINPDGTVADAKVTGSTLKDPTLEQKMADRIKRWKFGTLSTGEQMKISYTFDFSPV